MNTHEARRILGLGPDEDPAPHLAEFEEARKRIEEMVRAAPNAALAARYRIGLEEFEQALTVIRGADAPPKIDPAPEIVLPAEKPPAPTAKLLPTSGVEAGPEAVIASVPIRRGVVLLLLLMVFLTAAGGGAWYYYKNEESQRLLRQSRITFLEREGGFYVENRRWADAAKSYAEIEELSPGSEVAKLGRRSIEAGMAEEQTQFVGYWTGQAYARTRSRPARPRGKRRPQGAREVSDGEGTHRDPEKDRRRARASVARPDGRRGAWISSRPEVG
jgi:hypothetical protein